MCLGSLLTKVGMTDVKVCLAEIGNMHSDDTGYIDAAGRRNSKLVLVYAQCPR